jgi:hypothetical protein
MTSRSADCSARCRVAASRARISRNNEGTAGAFKTVQGTHTLSAVTASDIPSTNQRSAEAKKTTLHCPTIERDATYPNMWRIRRSDGSLSDMVNLTRAKDA